MMIKAKLLEKLASDIYYTARMTNFYASTDKSNLRDNSLYYGQFTAYMDVYRALTKTDASIYELYEEGEYILISGLSIMGLTPTQKRGFIGKGSTFPSRKEVRR